MINSVSNVMPTVGLDQVRSLQATETGTVSGPSFSDTLMSAIEKVNDQQITAEKVTETLATGKAPDLHTVMIASEKASVSFQLALQIRNKAVEAYQEIMRMQI